MPHLPLRVPTSVVIASAATGRPRPRVPKWLREKYGLPESDERFAAVQLMCRLEDENFPMVLPAVGATLEDLKAELARLTSRTDVAAFSLPVKGIEYYDKHDDAEATPLATTEVSGQRAA